MFYTPQEKKIGLINFWVSQRANIQAHQENYRGDLEITYYDSVRKIVAGRFSFDFWGSSRDTVKVREGRFDVRY